MFKTRHSLPGASPATLTPHTVNGESQKPVITVVEYNEQHMEERQIGSIRDLPPRVDDGKMMWINIDGLGDVEELRALGERFHLHPLTLEDVLTTGQRPKVEQYDDYLFIVAQMVYNDAEGKTCGEQVSMFLCKDGLITVQEEAEYDAFDPVRERLRSGRGLIRRTRVDYLAYALLDSVIDHYYPVLETLGQSIEEMEDDLIEHPKREMVITLHEFKRLLTQLRRFIWPLRDVVNTLLHHQTGHIDETTKIYLRDCYDHTVQLMDLVESYRDVTSGLMELYLSSVGLRTNEIMRVLTVISAIFIPLTFVAGVYGMNFAPDQPEKRTMWWNMPELYSPHGYLAVMLLMLAIAVVQILIFKRKRWL
jgi:magnesium transporter